MISSHDPATDADKAADLELAVEFWRTMHTRTLLNQATFTKEIAAFRDLMQNRADHGRNDGWPALVTASGVADTLTHLIEQAGRR